MADRPRLAELSVATYKNLDRVILAWSPQMVVYGPNGCGKSNLFEALALIAGSRVTTWETARRAIPPDPGSLSVVLTGVNSANLPLAPGYCEDEVSENPSPATLYAYQCGQFWDLFGIPDQYDGNWKDAVEARVEDRRLADLLVNASEVFDCRYRLESITGLEAAASFDRGASIDDEGDDPKVVQIGRQFSRCLVLRDLPSWLPEIASRLPEPFSPLRRWLDEDPASRSPFVDLLELPPSEMIPMQVVWLSSERTSREALSDAWDALDIALDPTWAVLHQLGQLALTRTEADDQRHSQEVEENARWWLLCQATDAMNASLAATMPHLVLNIEGQDLGSIEVTDTRYPSLSTSLREPSVLDRFSSGERVWVDQALADATAHLEMVAAQNTIRARALAEMQADDRDAVTLGLIERIQSIDDRPWIDPGEINLAMALVDGATPPPHLLFGIRGFEDAFAPLFLRLASTREKEALPIVGNYLTVRLYDEPERHLHPATQRVISAALESNVDDSFVAVATHSHLFLGHAGWEHVHVFRTPEGSVVTAFDPEELDLTHPITSGMGLTRGELLNRYRYVLFVEGATDELVLDTIYGPVLRDHGILLHPIWGINEALAVAELKVFGDLLDVGCGVLADHTKADRLDRALPKSATKEERILADLGKRMRRRGRQLDLFGLKAPDILAYLDESVIREHAPDFDGWNAIERRWRADRGSDFKDLAAASVGRPLDRRWIGDVATEMARRNIPAGGDMPSVIGAVVEAARQRS